MLYLRGKTWWTKFYLPGQKEPLRRSTGTAAKREAGAIAASLRQQALREHKAGRTDILQQHTYEDALLRWLAEGAPKSMWSHARNTRPYLDHIPLVDVVPAAHDMRAAMLDQGLSPLTINRRLAVVRCVLNKAFKRWAWVDIDFGKRIELLSEKGLSRLIKLNPGEFAELISTIEHPVARRVITLAAFTGLRRGELLCLQPRHWRKPYITLGPEDTKSGLPRTIPVIDLLHECVVLPFDITEWELRQAFEAARAKMGRPDLRLHDLRHTFASWLTDDATVPLTTVRDLLGHSSLSVTSKYTHAGSGTHNMVSGALASVIAAVNGTNKKKKGHSERAQVKRVAS